MRRRLHNTIQELKGNIRVFCRVRPSFKTEESNTEEKFITYPDDDKNITIEQSVESASGTKVAKAYPFSFDKVIFCLSLFHQC